MPVFCSDYLPQVVAYGSKSVAETNFNIAVMTSENSWPGWNKIHRNKEWVGNFSPFSLFFVGQVVTLNKGKSTHRTISKGQGLWTLFRVQVMKSELLEWLACFNEQNVCKVFVKYKVKNEIKRKKWEKRRLCSSFNEHQYGPSPCLWVHFTCRIWNVHFFI